MDLYFPSHKGMLRKEVYPSLNAAANVRLLHLTLFVHFKYNIALNMHGLQSFL